jgi:hypothetical protein
MIKLFISFTLCIIINQIDGKESFQSKSRVIWVSLLNKVSYSDRKMESISTYSLRCSNVIRDALERMDSYTLELSQNYQ